MKSEQTKSRKSLYLKMTSLVTGLLVPVSGVLCIQNRIVDGHVVLICFGFIALGILTIKIGRLSKFTVGVILGIIEVVFFAFLLFVFSFLSAGVLAEKKIYHDQMQSLSSLCQEYCEQNEGTLPGADTWCDQLLESVENSENDSKTNALLSYGHGGHKGERMSPYAYNKKLDGYRLGDVNRQTVLIFLSGLGWNQNGTSDILASYEHPVSSQYPQDGYHFVFVGPGSTFTVEFVKYSEVDQLNWEPAEQPAVAE